MTDLSPSNVTITAPGSVPDDTVSVVVNGTSISGWTDVRITRRCEGLPNDFDIALTAINPSDASKVVAYAGQPCSVKIGRDTVITGNIDQDTVTADSKSHRLGIVGRGKCADLVECSAEWSGGQISGADAVAIAGKLADPYGISVYLASSGAISLKPIPQFNLNYGETAQEIIDRICTYSGLLYYEDEYGDLVLSQVGATQAASGFVCGQNVQNLHVVNSMDGRFSDYTCSSVSVDIFGDLGGVSLLYFTAKDPNVPRHRVKYLVAESVSGSWSLCRLRALWMAARQAGRGTKVVLTADSWRDSGGTLWTPNTLAPVTLPGLRQPAGSQLCISEVVYRYGEDGGKLADITMMPPAAFTPQPIVIQPTPFATGEAVQAPGAST